MSVDNSIEQEYVMNSLLRHKHKSQEMLYTKLTPSRSFLPKLQKHSSQTNKMQYLVLESPTHSLNTTFTKKRHHCSVLGGGFGSNLQLNDPTETSRTKMEVSLPSTKNNSTITFKYQPSHHATNSNSQEISQNNAQKLVQIFKLNTKHYKKAVQNLLISMNRSNQVYQTCRKIHANLRRLNEVFQMIAPPINMDNQQEESHFQSLAVKAKTLYMKAGMQGEIQFQINKTYSLIELAKITYALEFFDLEINHQQVVSLIYHSDMLFYDQDYNNVTDYQILLNILHQTLLIKQETHKLLMISLQPDSRQKLSNDTDLTSQLIQQIDKKQVDDMLQRNKFQTSKKVTQKTLVQKIHTPPLPREQRKFIKVYKKFGLEPPMGHMTGMYDSHQDLQAMMGSDMNKYNFHALELGYINVKKNRRLLMEDNDLCEEYKVFGEDVSGTEYPVWIRALYVNQNLASDMIAMTKIYLYDPSEANMKNRSRDFISQPQLITDTNQENQFLTLVQERHQTECHEEVLKDELLVIKSQPDMRMDEIRDFAGDQQLYNNINTSISDMGSVIKDKINHNDPSQIESSCSEEDFEQEIMVQDPLFVKQIQSYQVYKIINNPIGAFQACLRKVHIKAQIARSVYQEDILEYTKQEFHLKEQFEISQAKVKMQYDARHVYSSPQKEPPSSEDDEWEINEEPLQSLSHHQEVQPEFHYVEANQITTQIEQLSNQTYKRQSLSSSVSIAFEKTKTIQSKKVPYSRVIFLEDMDILTKERNLNDFSQEQSCFKFVSIDTQTTQISTNIKNVNLVSDFIIGSQFQEIYHTIEPIEQKIQLIVVDVSSDETSFDEQPIYLDSTITPFQSGDEDELYNGMLVLKKELIMSFENGAGISSISIFHKDKMIHSLEGLNEEGKNKWKIKFFLPQEIRKYVRQEVNVSVKMKQVRNIQLMTKKIRNKIFLVSFQVGSLIRSEPQDVKHDETKQNSDLTDHQIQSLNIESQKGPYFESLSFLKDWCQGSFRLLVRFSNYYQLYEGNLFRDKLSWLVQLLVQRFSNVKIIEQVVEAVEYVDQELFEVLIQGVGPFQKRRGQGFYPLYVKTDQINIFLGSFEQLLEEAYLNLCLLCQFYGGSQQLAQAQRSFLLNDPQPILRNPYKFIDQ